MAEAGDPVAGPLIGRRVFLAAPAVVLAAGRRDGRRVTWGNNSTFQILIIQGSQAITGLFLYNGLGAPGNPPQFAAVASGVTSDPFGNAITSSKILIQGNVITEAGGIFRTAAAAPLIQLDGPHDALFVYDAAANLIATVTPAAGNDGLGHNFQAGITSYSSAGQIVELFSGGIIMQAPTQSAANATTIQPAVNGSGLALGISGGSVGADNPSSLFLGDSAATNTGLQVVSGQDGNTYRTERLSAAVASPGVSVGSVAFVNIPQVFNVAAAKYRIHAMISNVTTFAAGALNLQVNGTAGITDMSIVYWQTAKASNSAVNTNRIQALATVIGSTTFAASEQYIQLDGFVTFSSAGTFAVQVKTTANTCTVITDSFVDLMPV